MPRRRSQLIPLMLILTVSLAAAIAMTWLVPSLSAATLNMLFRLRGESPAPSDIVIVAVDDASLQQVGNWPWPRSVMATALDRITSANPRAIGLDVIYAEPSDPADDQLLTEAIRRNGRVVVPAQLTALETNAQDLSGSSTWLMPLPEIRTSAAATGHAHADPDVDGVLRTIQLSKADASGNRLWAFGLETLRVAEGLPLGAIEEKKSSLRLGPYEIATHDEAEQSTIPGVTIIRPNEMYINYLGPPGTFTYYSIADVLQGKVPASTFTNKIVLIGAVAQTMGDTRITPFVAYGGDARQSGTGMPGIEVHANMIETIRRGAWLRPFSDWLSFTVALLVMLGAAAIIRLLDGWRVVASLSLLLAFIIVGSLYAFNHYYLIPPVVPVLTGFLTVVPLLLLHNSITASRDLDRKIEMLAHIQRRFISRGIPQRSYSTPLSFLRSILRADTVALFRKSSSGGFQLMDETGRVSAERLPPETEDSQLSLQMPLVDESEQLGMLLIKRAAPGEPFTESERDLTREFAAGLASELKAAERSSQLRAPALPVSLPRNILWKLRAVDDITANLIARIGFMNRVLTSMTDGLLVANLTGSIVFANPAALPFWEGLETEALLGQSLADIFVSREIIKLDALRAMLREVLEGHSVQLEVEHQTAQGRFFTLQFSAVTADDDSAIEIQTAKVTGPIVPAQARPKIIGLIVIITDITKRKELDRVKAETLQLVSHELRTPLTSIQGLSDLLLKFPVSGNESQEMLEMIHSESVRMNELINRYLDIARLESNTQPLARRPVAVNDLIANCAQSLGPLAAAKEIKLNLKLAEPSPMLQGDAQLLMQAITNLLSNAIKYSRPASEVEISSMSDEAQVSIAVRDHGYGIPPEAQERVFEKFYRLDRDTTSNVVGTGLGLSLVKEIVERHGGHITLESEPDKGSTFTLHLPVQKT